MFGIVGGALYAWGYNNSGQLGTSNKTHYSSPVQVGSATNWTSISGCYYSSYGIAGGMLYAWGLNTSYELCQGNTTGKSSPVVVGIAKSWTILGVSKDNNFMAIG